MQKWINELLEKSRYDRTMIVGSEIRQLISHIEKLDGLLHRVTDECVENAGSDDPRPVPPSFELLGKITTALHKEDY